MCAIKLNNDRKFYGELFMNKLTKFDSHPDCFLRSFNLNRIVTQ